MTKFMWTLVVLLILFLCIIFFVKEKPNPTGPEETRYYLKKGWPARQSPVQIESRVGPYFYYGLGNCAGGTLSFFPDERIQATLKIDLRTMDFFKLEWPKRIILQAYDEPWMFIDTLETKKNQTVKVTWRGKSETYSAKTSLKKIPANSLGKDNPPVESFAYSLEFDPDIGKHGLLSHWNFKDFLKEKTLFLHGRKRVLRKMRLKELTPGKVHLRIHATFVPGQTAIPGEKLHIISRENVEMLGNPFKRKYKDGNSAYPRNVWDMRVFNEKIYLGHGNSNNNGPAPNAGPVDVWYWDIKENRFVKEFVVDDEQIDHYEIIGGRLIIPGHDPTEPWDLGNFYTLEDGQWKKNRTIPNGIHNYGMLEFKGKLFAALGIKRGGAVVMSEDHGITWSTFHLQKKRAFSLFSLNNKLYVSTFANTVYEYSQEGFRKVPVNLFPGARVSRNMRVARSVEFKDMLIYIGVNNSIDHQWTPFGLYKAKSIEGSENMKLPEEDSPYDIVINGSTCYVLVNSAPALVDGQYKYWVKVLKSEDLETWREIMRFEANTFARSFEVSGKSIYFGMGSSAARLSPETGNILRVSGVY